MNALVTKFKETLLSVLPITIIVTLLNFTLVPMEPLIFIQFLIGAGLIVIGLTIFLIGIDIGITPLGGGLGGWITKSGKLWILLIAGLLLGFFISFAEPDLHILASQIAEVTSNDLPKMAIVIVVSLGIAYMLAIGLLRIVYNFRLQVVLIILYGIILVLALFVPPAFLAIAFDSSGATTGALTVPFILALGAGASQLKKDSKSSEKDSFGLVAIASTGAIISVMIMSIIINTTEISGSLTVDASENKTIFGIFFNLLPSTIKDVFIALVPVVVIFVIFQRLKTVSRRSIRRMSIGLIFTFVGLILFMLGVNGGFMDVGTRVGLGLASMDSMAYVIGGGFALGLVTILAEPAINVLTHQIEDVTSGYVERKAVMFSMCIGVSAAVGLSIIRIVLPHVQLWNYLLPGYAIALALTFITPKLFVGIAFDAGGVATGPMTATFILAYVQGAAQAIEGADVMIDGFGMISMVALMPLITVQLLGIVFKVKSKKRGLDDNGQEF